MVAGWGGSATPVSPSVTRLSPPAARVRGDGDTSSPPWAPREGVGDVRGRWGMDAAVGR